MSSFAVNSLLSLREDLKKERSKRVHARKEIEQEWLASMREKQQRLLEELHRARDHGIRLHQQCEKYQRWDIDIHATCTVHAMPSKWTVVGLNPTRGSFFLTALGKLCCVALSFCVALPFFLSISWMIKSCTCTVCRAKQCITYKDVETVLSPVHLDVWERWLASSLTHCPSSHARQLSCALYTCLSGYPLPCWSA